MKKLSPIYFIFITVLLDAVGIGLLIPVMPDVLRRFTSDPVQVSRDFGYFLGLYSVMQFVASPILGSLSDRFGRKPILLISLCGAAIDYLFMGFAPTKILLFLGRLISGLTGASMTVASSFIADISDEKNRSSNFGMIGAGWGIGFILGPMLGGFLGAMGPRAPFIAAAGMNFFNFLFGVFVLPESLDPSNRRPITWSQMNPWTLIAKYLKPSPFVVLIWIYFIIFLAGQVHPVNWTLYTQLKFGWSAWQVGLSLSFVGIVIAFSQIVLTRILIPKLGEDRSIAFGLLTYAICFALFGFANESWMIYAVLLVFALPGITMPAIQSQLARFVPANQQGEMQGSLVALGSLSSILAPLIFTTLFVEFTRDKSHLYFPGVAYLAAAGFSFVALIVWILHQRKITER